MTRRIPAAAAEINGGSAVLEGGEESETEEDLEKKLADLQRLCQNTITETGTLVEAGAQLERNAKDEGKKATDTDS